MSSNIESKNESDPGPSTDTPTEITGPDTNDTTIELQLGDVIKISSPLNEQLNDQTFIIDYIDKTKAYLINTNTMSRLRLSISPDGIIGDGNISRIAILSRSKTASYAEQNDLLPGKWINIYFGGDLPVTLTGEITNLENDMIEVKTVDGDVIYLNFDYKGIPEDLPIDLIEIREKPSDALVNQPPLEEIPEDKLEPAYVDPSNLQLTIPVKDIKDQIREFIVKADNVQFGDEVFGPIVQYVDVAAKSQRYSIETQVSDLLDELLTTVPNAQRTPKVLNNIHLMIERFKQLRQRFSYFDQYGNVDGIMVKEASYKPLSTYFNQLHINLYWILPVVKNIKKIYNVDHVDEENNDVVNIDLTRDIDQIRELIDTYRSNDMPTDQNKYAELYASLNPYFTPYELVADENKDGIIDEKMTLSNINTVIDNLEEMYSSIYSSNAIRNRRFVIQKYNTALSKLDTIDATSSKMITVRTNITDNDILSIKSFITLPEPVMRFSKINLPGTSILEKANLNLAFVNYWQLLKKKTNISTTFVDNLETGIEFNEQNFANNIKNFALNLSDEATQNMTRSEIYAGFANAIIPKTRVLFNLMKKYITGKLSIVEVVSFLEPFLVYSDDLTYMQYKEIVEFIDARISEYNKKFIERGRIFKMIYQSRMNQRTVIPSRAFSVIDILKKMRNEVIVEGYGMTEPEGTFTNSEILRKLTLKDNARLYTTALAVQSFPLTFPSEFSILFEEEKTQIDNKLKKDRENNKCKTITIAKYYGSINRINEDNDKPIYFDKKYDKTNYGMLEESYGKEVMIMSPDELRDYIVRDLLQKKKMSESDAEYLANTLVDGHKKVIDGQFALLYKGYQENIADEVDYYVRKNNKWELDTDLSKESINTDDSTILCDIQEQCVNVPGKIDDKCESTAENELGMQTKLLKDVMSEFDTKYKMSKQELQTFISSKFEYLMSIVTALTKIETDGMFKYNNQKFKLGASTGDDAMTSRPVSPYQQLLDLILRQADFVRKQHDIIKFVNTYTRPYINGIGPLNETETEHWLYCIKTNVPILPTFKFELATAFVVNGQYAFREYLELVKSKIGKQSDDGEWWCDENSGWPICPTEFDVEEGYDEGFKVSTRAIMEDDAGNKIVSAAAEKKVTYETPDSKMINNIVNTLSFAMGINITNQKEFIINSVLSSIRDTVDTEGDHKRKVKEMAEKGKKMPPYKDVYNTAILYYTLGMFLIAVQTAIPSVKTRKTHPGCVRSFTGYPFEGAGDMSSLTYLGCVAYDIRDSGDPWNVLKGKKSDNIIIKIKGAINDVLLSIPDVKRKMEEKTEYLLTNPADDIPEEHAIDKWAQFLPPLVNYKIKHLVNISTEFKKSLMSDLRSGAINQRDKLNVIESKIIQFSLAIVERIQVMIQNHKLLLHTSANEPYLENACCESNENETTIEYFSSRDKRIPEYNDIVTQLSNMMADIISYSSAGLFYSTVNTKNKYPAISNDFSEKTIYLSFISFCKFKSLIPIPLDLLPLCTGKPDIGLINPNDSDEQLIQKLKDDGRVYTNDHFLRLLQIISQQNTINILVKEEEVSSLTKLAKLIESIQDEPDEVVEQSLRDLIVAALDTYEVASENYTKEVKALNNYLIKHIETMKAEIVEFVQKNTGSTITNSSVRKLTAAVNNLAEWSADKSTRHDAIKISDDKLYNVVGFYKNFINNFVNVFPNIILNKVHYDDTHIPNYYGFSRNHANKLKKYIGEYYENLKHFYGIPSLQNVLTTIQNSCKNLVLLANLTPSFTSIQIGNEKTMKPVLDERTSRFLFEYYLLRIFINYIELSDEDDMIVREIKKVNTVNDIVGSEYVDEEDTRVDMTMLSINQTDTRLLTGNKKELRQKVAELFVAFVDIMNTEKNTIDTSYEDIQDRVFKLREKEKDLVTDRLKKMTDEARDADTILKANKLGMYSKGMQKGLTALDKDFYDEEQEFRDEMTKAERNIRKKNADATDENMDILLGEYLEQQQTANEIDNEAYDMDYMNETYFDGNTDGVGAPEEEYEDYQEDS